LRKREREKRVFLLFRERRDRSVVSTARERALEWIDEIASERASGEKGRKPKEKRHEQEQESEKPDLETSK
jgi:hypothetical protein